MIAAQAFVVGAELNVRPPSTATQIFVAVRRRAESLVFDRVPRLIFFPALEVLRFPQLSHIRRLPSCTPLVRRAEGQATGHWLLGSHQAIRSCRCSWN